MKLKCSEFNLKIYCPNEEMTCRRQCKKCTYIRHQSMTQTRIASEIVATFGLIFQTKIEWKNTNLIDIKTYSYSVAP